MLATIRSAATLGPVALAREFAGAVLVVLLLAAALALPGAL